MTRDLIEQNMPLIQASEAKDPATRRALLQRLLASPIYGYYAKYELEHLVTEGAAKSAAKAPASAPPPARRPPPRDRGPDLSREIVAVFDVQDVSGRLEPASREQLSEYLAAKVAEEVRCRIVPRNQLVAELRQQKGESYKECYDESCQIGLGKALAASITMATKLIQIGSKCAISTSLFDLKTETTITAASVRTSCDVDALMDGADKLVAKLSND